MSKEDRAYVLAFGILASILALWLAGTITIGGVNLAEPYEHAPMSTEREGPTPQPTEPPIEALGGYVGVAGTGENPLDRDVSESLLLGGASSTESSPSSEDPPSLSPGEALPWYWRPSERALLHVYTCEAAYAGESVDPLIVRQIWDEDRSGVRMDLLAFQAAWFAYRAALEEQTDEEALKLLEEARVRALGPLWRRYSPEAYVTYTELYGVGQ